MNIDALIAPWIVWNITVTIALCCVWVRRGLPAVYWVEHRRKIEREELVKSSREPREVLATDSRVSHEDFTRALAAAQENVFLIAEILGTPRADLEARVAIEELARPA